MILYTEKIPQVFKHYYVDIQNFFDTRNFPNYVMLHWIIFNMNKVFKRSSGIRDDKKD